MTYDEMRYWITWYWWQVYLRSQRPDPGTHA